MKSIVIHLWYDAFVNNDKDSKELFSIVEAVFVILGFINLFKQK